LKPSFGFLAVDLFFVLSGFVLAYGYDRKFAAGMRAQEFMLKRVIRLYPLFLLGLLLGFGLRLIPAIRAATTTGGPMTLHELGLAAAFNALMLPGPEAAQNGFLFPADLPGWSLFFELWVANFAFACFWKRLQGRGLAIVIASAGLLMLANEAYFHTIDVGALWSTFAGGFARVAFSFAIGMAIARLHAARAPRLRVPSWCIWIAVTVILFAPLPHMLGHLYELVCASCLFPVLIYFGAEAMDSTRGLASALGDASYAAYVIHVPLLSLVAWLVPGWVAHPSEIHGLAFALGVCAIALMLARFYDEPVRQIIERWFAQKQRGAVVAQPL
jgi:peptidoglycan/LPS O-acetylase OafA/YrhL